MAVRRLELASLHRGGGPTCNPQSAQCSPVLPSASIRNAPSVHRTIAPGVRTWNCAGPGTASNWVPEAPDGVRSAALVVEIPSLPTKAGLEGARGRGIV
eukprot:3708261-Alexandrium_andersonii.AAC.1